MLPSRHFIVSFSLGAIIYYFTKSIAAGVICLFAGVLVDLDHIIDYVINVGLKEFNFKEMYWDCIKLPHQKESSKIKHVFLFFHSWEMVVLLWLVYIFTRNIYMLAFSVGYTGHIFLDSAARALNPLAYSLIYRIKRNLKPMKFLHSRFK